MDFPKALGVLENAVSKEIWELRHQMEKARGRNDSALVDELERLEENEVYELGREAVRIAVAPLFWSASIGERWDVRTTSGFLGVSRQMLYKRLRAGTILGLRGYGTTWFPTWQFEVTGDRGIVRPMTPQIVKAFRDADPDLDPLVIADWATRGQSLLEGDSPAAWIYKGGDPEAVVLAAKRAASGLAV
ncbi:MAG: hypothetical protein WCF24_13050 [Acidimicrobiales bacterium]